LTYFGFASSGFGQTTANMVLTGVNGSSYAGIYTSPYYATVNGVATTVICDDFGTESSINESWTAYVSNVSGVTSPSAKFSGANVQNFGITVTTQQAYDAVAALATALLGVSSSSAQATIYSFAIWDIFDNSGVNSWPGLSPSFLAEVNADALAALKATYTAGEFSNVSIYSSTVGTPQEFISVGQVATPEASSPAILAIDIFALGIIVWLFRRRGLRLAPNARTVAR
jgi:hypothetical protein